jgi:hypothetical protein
MPNSPVFVGCSRYALDYGRLNVSMEPFAFVGDSLPDNEQWDLHDAKLLSVLVAYFPNYH